MTEFIDPNTNDDIQIEDPEDDLGLPDDTDEDDDELNIDDLIKQTKELAEDDEDEAQSPEDLENNKSTEKLEAIDLEEIKKYIEDDSTEDVKPKTPEKSEDTKDAVLDEVDKFIAEEISKIDEGDDNPIQASNINDELVVELPKDLDDDIVDNVAHEEEKTNINNEREQLVVEIPKAEETEQIDEKAASFIESSPVKSPRIQPVPEITPDDEDIIFDPQNDLYVCLVYPPNRKPRNNTTMISEKAKEKKSNIPRCFSATKKQKQAPVQNNPPQESFNPQQTQLSSLSTNLANERNERLIRGTVGPRKLLTKMQAETVLKIFNITGETSLKVVNQCSTSGGKVSAENIINFLMTNTNPKLHTPTSVLVKTALNNMRNTVLSPRKK